MERQVRRRRRFKSSFTQQPHFQSFYAHFFKLLALFCIAVAHLIYMQAFLDAYTAMEDYTFKLNTHFAPSHPATTTITPLEAASNQLLGISTTLASPLATKPTDPEPLDPNQLRDFNLMLDQMGLLADYKRNTWMTVGSMCVALCTSSFFLFILPITELCKKRELLMGIIDLLSFTAIPILLTMRVYIVEALNAALAPGMLGAHKILSTERVMNILQCTILPREKVGLG
jgi:hypothetical protein